MPWRAAERACRGAVLLWTGTASGVRGAGATVMGAGRHLSSGLAALPGISRHEVAGAGLAI